MTTASKFHIGNQETFNLLHQQQITEQLINK